MPNIRGPKSSTRKLINSVVHSQLLYAAPTFATAMIYDCNRSELQKPQRLCALRVISAYRTVSTPAALVLAGTPPIDLLVLEREEIYNLSQQIGEYNNIAEKNAKKLEIRNNARASLLTKWQERWQEENRGRWTHQLIPNIKSWIERKHGDMNFFLTQAFTNHGNFNKYLNRFKIKDTCLCDTCETFDDTASHMIFSCKRWEEQRQEINILLQDTITPDNIIEIMLSSKEKWMCCEKYITSILEAKSTQSSNLL